MILYQVFFKGKDTALIGLDVGKSDRGELKLLDENYQLFSLLKAQLARKYNPFGHLFNPERASAIDLNYALNSLKGSGFDAVILQGDEFVSNYDPGLTENSIT